MKAQIADIQAQRERERPPQIAQQARKESLSSALCVDLLRETPSFIAKSIEEAPNCLDTYDLASL